MYNFDLRYSLYITSIKKAPIIKIGAFESGRRNRIRTNDLYHVKVGQPKPINVSYITSLYL